MTDIHLSLFFFFLDYNFFLNFLFNLLFRFFLNLFLLFLSFSSTLCIKIPRSSIATSSPTSTIFLPLFLHVSQIIFHLLTSIIKNVFEKSHTLIDHIFKVLRNLLSLSIDLKWILFIINNSKYFNWSLTQSLNLQKWMLVSNCSFTFFTKIEIWANSTFISYSFDIPDSTTVTGNSSMNNDWRFVLLTLILFFL